MFLRNITVIRDRTALVDENGKQFTYGDLEKLSKKYEQWIPSRSLVMILCDYCINTVAFYYCQMSNKVVPILLDKKLEQGLLERLIQLYQPQYIWIPEEREGALQDYRKEDLVRLDGHILLKTIYGKCDMHSDLALLMTTSGSTGSPKLVRITYDGIQANMEAYKNAIGLREDDRMITTLPMNYCYGLSNLHLHWLAGASVYVTELSMLNIRFWDFFETAKITNFAGVPYTYEILQKIKFFEKNYSSLRFLTQAGAKLPEKKQRFIAETLKEKGIKFFLCYGQTEATTYISLLQAEKAAIKLGSVGCALEGMSAYIECPDKNGVGELVCKGESISFGYATRRSMLAEEDMNHGILYTGDLAYMDAEGDIFIRGRIKRFIKMLGERISLDEIEELLSKEYPECEFACMGEDNILNIYCTKLQNEKNIIDFCRQKLGLKSKMCFVKIINNIPRNAAGKILYGELS